MAESTDQDVQQWGLSMARQRMPALSHGKGSCLQPCKSRRRWLCLALLAFAVALVLLGHRPDILHRKTHDATGMLAESSLFFHIGIVTMMESSDRQVSEVVTYLLPSWAYTVSQPEAAKNIVDLLIFCEQPYCALLPPTCRQLVNNDGRLTEHDDVANCWWHPVSEGLRREWKDDQQMIPIAVLLEQPFPDIAKRYNLLLRTHEDYFVGPRLLTYRPLNGASFGRREVVTEQFTRDRLHRIAAKLDIVHGGVYESGLTWLAPPEIVLELADTTVTIGRNLLEEEFGSDKPGLEQWGASGSWPQWWRDVASVYAANLAAHVVFPNFDKSFIAKELEVPADSSMYLETAVHMHSFKDPAGEHAAYMVSSPEERKTQHLAVSTIDKDTLVKEYTFTIAMRSVQAMNFGAMLPDVKANLPLPGQTLGNGSNIIQRACVPGIDADCTTVSFTSVMVYGWSTCVDPIIKELVQTLKDTMDLPVRENPSTWDPLDSTDDKTLFILLVPQTVSTYPMYYVAYQTEQWGTFFLDEGSTSWGMPRGTNETANYKQAMEGALEVWDYSRYNIENYARRVRKTQPRLQYVPFSFLSTKSGIPLHVERDVDVLFFGGLNPQREAIIADVNATGVSVRVLAGGTMKFGEDLDNVLARTKIVLNLHYYHGVMEMSRLQHAISLRCLVVSQRSLEPELDAEWGDKVVIADDKDIPRQLKYFLDHPKEREARVEKAYRHSKEKYRLEDWLRQSTFLSHYMHGGQGTGGGSSTGDVGSAAKPAESHAGAAEKSENADGAPTAFVESQLQSAEGFYADVDGKSQGGPGVEKPGLEDASSTMAAGDAAAFKEPVLRSAEDFYAERDGKSENGPLVESDEIGSTAEPVLETDGERPISDAVPEIEGEPFWNAAAAGRIEEEPQAALSESALLPRGSQDASEASETVLVSDVGELPDVWYKEEWGTGEEPFWNNAGRPLIRVKKQQAKQASKGRQSVL